MNKLIKNKKLILIVFMVGVVIGLLLVGFNKNKTSTFTQQNIRSTELDLSTQTENDIDTAKKFAVLKKDYPWYSKLPIDTTEYMIIFDWDQQKFQITLKKGVGTYQARLDKALTNMKSLDIPVSATNYYVLEEK